MVGHIQEYSILKGVMDPSYEGGQIKNVYHYVECGNRNQDSLLYINTCDDHLDPNIIKTVVWGDSIAHHSFVGIKKNYSNYFLRATCNRSVSMQNFNIRS